MINTSRINRLAGVLAKSEKYSAVYDRGTGQKLRYTERVKILDKYEGRDDVFVSFTTLNKLGINPQSHFSTPIGVYAYPVDYVISVGGDIEINVPYPSSHRQLFMHVFQVSGMSRVLHLNSDDKKILDEYRGGTGETPKELIDRVSYIISNVVKYVEDTRDEVREHLSSIIDSYDYEEDSIQKWYREWRDGLDSRLDPISKVDKRLYGILYDVGSFNLYNLARLVSTRVDLLEKRLIIKAKEFLDRKDILLKVEFPYERELKRLVIGTVIPDTNDYLLIKERVLGRFIDCDQSFVYKMTEEIAGNPRRWTSLMRGVGIVGIVDFGTQTIHAAEPTQAVFFDPKSLRILETIDSKQPQQFTKYRGTENIRFSQWSANLEESVEEAIQAAFREVTTLSTKFNSYRLLRIISWLNLNATPELGWTSEVKRKMLEEVSIESEKLRNIAPEGFTIDRVIRAYIN